MYCPAAAGGERPTSGSDGQPRRHRPLWLRRCHELQGRMSRPPSPMSHTRPARPPQPRCSRRPFRAKNGTKKLRAATTVQPVDRDAGLSSRGSRPPRKRARSPRSPSCRSSAPCRTRSPSRAASCSRPRCCPPCRDGGTWHAAALPEAATHDAVGNAAGRRRHRTTSMWLRCARNTGERDKRLRREGSKQFLHTADELAGLLGNRSAFAARGPGSDFDKDVDVAVIGGGFAGLIVGAHLKQAGVEDVRIIEMGGDFGGVWYWNRYPGHPVRQRSLLLHPAARRAGLHAVEEIRRRRGDLRALPAHRQAFGLYEGALFGTLVRALRWDETIKRWRIRTNRGDDIRARFVVMALGPCNSRSCPASRDRGLQGAHVPLGALGL